jgi:hypothetical protein
MGASRPSARAVVLAVASALLVLSVAWPAVTGATATEGTADSPWHHRAADGSLAVDLWYGYTSTCPYCRAARPFIEGLERDLPWLTVHWMQADGEDAMAAVARLDELAAMAGSRFESVPIFLFGGRAMVGWESEATTGARLEAGLIAYRASLGVDPATSPPPIEDEAADETVVTLPLLGRLDAATASLPLMAVVLGGLDSLNPCALAVLLFLMSVLAGSGDRRRMALVGGVFVAVTGIVTFVLMAAWLNVFLLFGALRWVTVAAGVAAVVVALINLKDHVWFGRGVSLVIPGSARPTIFGRMLDIPEKARLRAILLTTVIVAAVANMYEMLCTGGFPVVFTRALTLQELPAPAYYGYLLLYALVYVVPPALIVLGFVVTLGSRGVSVREARDLKLLSGLLMLGFGMLLLLAPDLLSELGATLTLFGGAVAAWLVILVAGRLAARRSAPHPAR